MTHETRENGKTAELRVLAIAQALFGCVTMGSPEQDYAQKTDLVVDGCRIQVSVSTKLRKEQKSLSKRGITPIAAGPQVSDEKIREQLIQLKQR